MQLHMPEKKLLTYLLLKLCKNSEWMKSTLKQLND